MNEKKNADLEIPICFIIGSPRSGTTILCDVLDRHPQIESISEPYFIWDWFHGGGEDDVRSADDADKPTKDFIRQEFSLTLKKSGLNVLVEKTPENCFRIPYMLEIFPEAYWINLYRDGRDVVVSMDKEWKKRKQIVEKKRVTDLLKTAGRMLSRQKYFRNRFLALRHEASQNFSLNPHRFFNKAKWKGRAAWGPRFPEWEKALNTVENSVQFNAMQWRECIRYSQKDINRIDNKRIIDISYEEMVQYPDNTLKKICLFLGVDTHTEIGKDLSPKSIGNYKTYFSPSEIEKIETITKSELLCLGYKTCSLDS